MDRAAVPLSPWRQAGSTLSVCFCSTHNAPSERASLLQGRGRSERLILGRTPFYMRDMQTTVHTQHHARPLYLTALMGTSSATKWGTAKDEGAGGLERILQVSTDSGNRGRAPTRSPISHHRAGPGSVGRPVFITSSRENNCFQLHLLKIPYFSFGLFALPKLSIEIRLPNVTLKTVDHLTIDQSVNHRGKLAICCSTNSCSTCRA